MDELRDILQPVSPELLGLVPQTLAEAEALAVSIEKAVQQETAGGVANLSVHVRGGRVWLHGSCSSYLLQTVGATCRHGRPRRPTPDELHRGRLRLTEPPSNTRRVAITVRGVVQGVGFRPFVYRTARDRGLVGWVRNEADAVRLEVCGPAADVADFVDSLGIAAPPQARVDSVEIEELPPISAQALTRRDFRDSRGRG